MKNLAKKLFHFLLFGLILFPISCTRTIIEPISPEGTTKVYGKPVFADNLYYFPKEALQNIKSYQNNILVLSDLSGIINANVGPSGRIAAHDVEVGDYLVSEPAPNAPQGFFGRAKSVIKNGADYVVETSEATFEDVFKDVHFKSELIQPMSFPINEKKIPLKAKNIAGTDVLIEATLSGNVNFIFNTQLELQSKDYEFEKALLSITTTHNHNLKLKFALGYELDKSTKDVKIPLIEKTFTIVKFVGWFPIVVFETVGIYAKLSLNGKVSIETEVIKKSTSVVGSVYERGIGWQNINIPEKDNNSTLETSTSIDLEGELKLGAYAGVDYNFYGNRLAKISGEIGVYGKLTIGCNGQKLELLREVGAEMTLGLTLYLFSSKPWTQPFEIEIPLSKKEFPPINITDCSGVSLPTSTNTSPDFYEGGKSFGDPNIVTFDEKSYSFNGVGEFIATKSSIDNFEIQVRQEELKNRNSLGSVSWSTGLAMNTGSDKLCFYPNKYYINQIPYNYSSSMNNTLLNGGSITGNTQTFVVSTSVGDIVKIFNRDDALDYSIIPSSQRQGKLIGIFGNYDGQPTNDLQIRNGSPIDGSYGTLYPNFTNSWRIAQNQSLFVYDAGKNTDSYTDKNFPRSALAISNTQRANAEQVCENAGVVPPFLEGCINDVVATSDNSMANRSKNLQDEKVLKSFNIDFGNTDRSLYSWTSGVTFGSNYALWGEEKTYEEGILFNNIVPVRNGFEITLYMSAEKGAGINDITIEFTNNYRGSTFDFAMTFSLINSGNNTFTKLINYSTSPPIDLDISNLNLYDGKIHKINIISSLMPNLNTTQSVFIDNKMVFSKNDIKEYLMELGFPVVETSTGGYDNYGKVKLYNFSYKSL